jgi:sodium/hydrogen exchanger-like protein 6/7
MSRRTQLTTKFLFQVMSQLSENFIFIYLGLSLFTEAGLEYKPLFILVTVVGICVARYCAVFPLSKAINYCIRYRARKLGREEADVLPKNHQMMLYWAGLRGAVGVALAAGLQGPNGFALRATVLVVVVLTVIIFGGTTARMLEILEIRTGVVEEIDSDDEFDIEVVPGSVGMFTKKGGAGLGHRPRTSTAGGISLASVANGRPRAESRSNRAAIYSSSNASSSPPVHPGDGLGRRASSRSNRKQSSAEQGLLYPDENGDASDDDESGLDLPPSAKRSPLRDEFPMAGQDETPYADSARLEDGQGESSQLTARGAFSQLMNATTEDAGTLFSRIDEGFIKPHLLLDPGNQRIPRPHGSS